METIIYLVNQIQVKNTHNDMLSAVKYNNAKGKYLTMKNFIIKRYIKKINGEL